MEVPPPPPEPNLLQAALQLAHAGYFVFPVHSVRDCRCTCGDESCTSAAKHPRTVHGFKDASRDPAIITEWWSRSPDANIGIRTGTEVGLIVVDVDPRNGGAGTLNQLVAEGTLSGAPTVASGGGGLHFYFNVPAGASIRSGNGALGPGVDVKADGYVVAPPSLHHSGVRYQWTGAPQWIGDALMQRLAIRPERAEAPLARDPDRVSEGGRNVHLTSLAGAMRRVGAGGSVIAAALEVENRDLCDPPLAASEVHKLAHGIAVRYAPTSTPLSKGGMVACTVSLATVTPEPVTWIWQGRIVCGGLTMLDGDPGLGKSTLAINIAARVTTGHEMPDGTSGISGGVVILSAEDDLGRTIRPRLEAAGADLSRVLALTHVISKGEKVLVAIPDHVAAIEQACDAVKAKLIIIDPLMAYLGGGVNSFRDQDVRRGLARLVEFAQQEQIAILIIRHLNKSPGAPAVYRGGGSIGLIGAARVGLLVARDRDDALKRVLAVIKCNLAPLAPSLAFSVESTAGGVPELEWHGEVAISADELLAPSQGAKTASKKEEAEAFLRAVLAGGQRPQASVEAEGLAQGFSIATLRRAKEAVGITSVKTGNGKARWDWALEGAHPPSIEHLRATAESTTIPLPFSEPLEGAHGLRTDSMSTFGGKPEGGDQ